MNDHRYPVDRDLALVVGAARSGTTLMRLLLDSHPEVGCPSEAGIPGLMAHMARVWTMVNADGFAPSERHDPGVPRREWEAPNRWGEAHGPGAEKRESPGGPIATLPADARAWIVRAVQVPMTAYCSQGRKRIYCDKSLDSVNHLELVRELFPGVRMVLIFRHVMDSVASGVEASPWGYQGYGYGPYVQSSPGNAVAALASYWHDHVSRALSWESEHPDMCHRVRYEDLVLAPEETVAAIERFLGVDDDLSVLARAFCRKPPRGPGDYKVEHTTGIHAGSVGRGKRVPVTMLPPPLLKALNEQLEALGYEPLDRGWNTAERVFDRGGCGLWAARLVDLIGEVSFTRKSAGVGAFAVVAEDHRALRWVFDPCAGTIERGDGDVEGVLTGTAEDLVLTLTGEENLGVLLRSGRIRHVVADVEQTARRDLIGELNAIVRLLRHRVGEPREDEMVG